MCYSILLQLTKKTNVENVHVPLRLQELQFITKTYCLTLDAVLHAAKEFTTPLDRLDWEDLSMGTDNIKAKLVESDTQEAVGFIHSGAVCIMDVLKNELIVDALQGRLVPKARLARPKRPEPTPATQAPQTLLSSPTQFTKTVTSSSTFPAPVSHSPAQEPRSEHPSPALALQEGQATRAKGLLQPAAPTLGASSSTMAGSNHPSQPVSSTTRRPSSASSQNVGPSSSSRPTRTLPARPELKDEDFFSILNEPSG